MKAAKSTGWLLGLILLATGCGGSSAKHAEAPSKQGQAAYPAAAADASPAGGRVSAESAAAPALPQQAPAERPGLGTEWGETRISRVHDVSFVRDSARPFAMAMLNYNDRQGAEAMAPGRRESLGEVEVGGGAVTLTIQDADGRPFETLQSGSRTVVVGQPGERYSIVLTNHTSHRFESVVTVDGLDVVNGKPGTLEHRGYLLQPFATLSIDGFRQSSNAVAAFRFASVADSYAAQTGSARNVGVIGAAFFGERGDSPVSPSDLRLRETASPFPADPRFARPPRR